MGDQRQGWHQVDDKGQPIPESDRPDSLADALPKEQARCRSLLGVYREIGPAGRLGALMIEQALQRADRAASSGDVVAMLRAYAELRGFKE